MEEMEVILEEIKKAAAASLIPEFEAPGFIGFFSVYTNSSSIRFNPGDEVAASQLSYSAINDPAAFMIQSSTHPAGGTWRCLGFAGYQGQSVGKAVMPFQRVDTLPPQPVKKLRGLRTGGRNCTYSAPDESMIDCEVFMRGGGDHLQHVHLITRNGGKIFSVMRYRVSTGLLPSSLILFQVAINANDLNSDKKPAEAGCGDVNISS